MDGAIGWIGWESLSAGTMEKALRERGPVPLHVVGVVCRQLLFALNAVHYMGRVHNDVSPRSILLSYHGDVRLGNLHFCRQTTLLPGRKTPSAESFRGPWKYMAPERVTGLECSYASDMWSLGITLLELSTKAYPYPEECTSSVEAMRRAIVERPAPTNRVPAVGGTLERGAPRDACCDIHSSRLPRVHHRAAV